MKEPTSEAPYPHAGWSRRRFVGILSLASGGIALGIGGWANRHRLARGGGAATGAALTESDLLDLTAVAEHLFPPEDEREARDLRDTVRWWASGRSRRGPYGEVYTRGLEALSDAVGEDGIRDSTTDSARTGFAALEPDSRARVVEALMQPGASEPFRALADELIHGIYTAAPGWRSLGYTTWPGVGSPPLEYTRPPGPPPRTLAGRSAPRWLA